MNQGVVLSVLFWWMVGLTYASQEEIVPQVRQNGSDRDLSQEVQAIDQELSSINRSTHEGVGAHPLASSDRCQINPPPSDPTQSKEGKNYIPVCCIPVEMGSGMLEDRLKKPFSVDFDPYVSGFAPQKIPSYEFKKYLSGYWVSKFFNHRRKYFSFNSKGIKAIGDPLWIRNRISYEIEPKKSKEEDQVYYRRRLKSELNLSDDDFDRRVTFAGSGSQSYVYWVHDFAPSAEELEKLYKDPKLDIRRKRELWAKENSLEVIKVRNPNPWDKKDEKVAAIQAERDLVMGKVFNQLAEQFQFYPNGEGKSPGVPLVRAIEYEDDPEGISRGFLRQKAVHGESVWNIAYYIRMAIQGHPDAEKILVDQLKFKSLKDAILRVNALENFYRMTHQDVRHFQKVNQLENSGILGVAGYTHNHNAVKVGFDFNLAQNVMWDPKEQIFKAFDY